MGFIARRVAKRAQQYKSVDDYLKDLWRPLMAWVYAVTVMFDFVLAPILLGVYTVATGQRYIQWQPLTIQGGGMFHIAMGAVIGVSSYSHSQEKINGSERGATNGGGNFPNLPAGWDPNTVRTGPLMPAYAPPPDDPSYTRNQMPSAAPGHPPAAPGYGYPPPTTPGYPPAPAPMTPPAPTPAPHVPSPVQVEVTVTPPAQQTTDSEPTIKKTATGFPKAKRF